MGHTRIGRLNRSRRWREVVALYCAGADPTQVADAVLYAAEDGFHENRLFSDFGYQKAVWLLVQMGIAAQSGNFHEHMKKCGILLSSNASVQELNAKLGQAIIRSNWGQGVKSDIAEFAKSALQKAVLSAVDMERGQVELPGMPHRPDVSIFNNFGSKENFAELNRRFASEFMARGIESYLAKIAPNLLGTNERVMSIHEMDAAYKAIREHCYETGIVERDYADQWLGLHKYKLRDMSDRLIEKHGTFLIKKMFKALRYGKD